MFARRRPHLLRRKAPSTLYASNRASQNSHRLDSTRAPAPTQTVCFAGGTVKTAPKTLALGLASRSGHRRHVTETYILHQPDGEEGQGQMPRTINVTRPLSRSEASAASPLAG